MFCPLSEPDRGRIHEGALRVLEEVGLLVPRPALRDRLRDLGLGTGDAGDRLRLGRATVARALAAAPRVVRLGARDRGRAITLDGSRTHAATDGCGSNAIDPKSGQPRPSTLADVAASARLVDALQEFDLYWTMVSAQDVPCDRRVALEYLTALRNTVKPVQVIDMGRPEEARTLLAMARALTAAGAVEGPPLSALVSVVSPLRLDPDGTEAALALAAAGLPVVACSMPIAGVTAPATSGGCLLLAHAESLALATILETASPGAPVIYCSFASFAHGRTGATNYWDPRVEWTNAAAAQLGRSVGLPSFSGGGLLAMMTGPDLLSGGGLLETSTLLALEQLVIENEALRDCRRACAAPDLEPEALAVELIARVGPGGHFLAERHTLEHMKRFVVPSFREYSDRLGDDARARALAEAQRLIQSRPVPPLPPEVDAALERIANEGARAR